LFANYRSNTRFTELFRRDERNPILTGADWPYPANSVFNPGAIRLSDGQTLLLARVEDRTGISHLTAARSQDANWQIDPHPTLVPDPKNYPEEVTVTTGGDGDPRLVVSFDGATPGSYVRRELALPLQTPSRRR